MKILFIGGTGVISSACSQLCSEKGYDLVLLNRGTSFRSAPKDAEIIHVDIRNVDAAKNAIGNRTFNVVVDWIAYNKEHVENDFNLFRDKTDQYIFISSASAYQKPVQKLPITEETPLENPFWSYARAKIDCENFLMKAYHGKKFPVTICRPSHTYDKTKNPIRSDYLLFHRMKLGKKIIIHDDGNSLWTVTHARDFAKGFIGLLGNSQTIGEAYQITSDEVLSWNKIAKILTVKAGYDLDIAHLPSSFIFQYDKEWGEGLLGDKANNAVFDNSKIKNLVTGFTATIPFSQGAEEIVEWYSDPKNQIVDQKLDELMDKMIKDYYSK